MSEQVCGVLAVVCLSLRAFRWGKVERGLSGSVQ